MEFAWELLQKFRFTVRRNTYLAESLDLARKIFFFLLSKTPTFPLLRVSHARCSVIPPERPSPFFFLVTRSRLQLLFSAITRRLRDTSLRLFWRFRTTVAKNFWVISKRLGKENKSLILWFSVVKRKIDEKVTETCSYCIRIFAMVSVFCTECDGRGAGSGRAIDFMPQKWGR